jgi:hypothetical protein
MFVGRKKIALCCKSKDRALKWDELCARVGGACVSRMYIGGTGDELDWDNQKLESLFTEGLQV